MKNCLVKPALVLVCIVLVALPLFAQRGKGGGGSTGCAIVGTPRLSTTTTTTEPNSAVGVFDRVTNCATGKRGTPSPVRQFQAVARKQSLPLA